MVDYNNKNALKLEEVHELFKWTLKGIGKITHNQMPSQKSIQLISYKAFNSADSDGSATLDLLELKNWIEINQAFIQFCEKYGKNYYTLQLSLEPVAKTNYDYSVLEKFPEFDVTTFTDIVLDTQSDMSMINKATFSSVQRLLQSSEQVKEKLLKSSHSIENIKRYVQRQEQKLIQEQQNNAMDGQQFLFMRKRNKIQSQQSSPIRSTNDKLIFKTQSCPNSPPKSISQQKQIEQSERNSQQTQSQISINIDKVKKFQKQFGKYIQTKFIPNEEQIVNSKPDEEQQFTPLNEYQERQKFFKSLKKIHKINRIKEVLEFKEKQNYLNFVAIQNVKQQQIVNNQKSSMMQLDQDKRQIQNKGSIRPRIHTSIKTARQSPSRKDSLVNTQLQRKPTLFINTQSKVGGKNIITSTQQSLDFFNDQKRRFLQANFINLRGRIYSRKQIQQMKQFFDQIDIERKGYITIDDYVKDSQKVNALKKISNSLFKHFDKDGMGMITFEDMLLSMVPGATESDLEKMLYWVSQMKDGKQQRQQQQQPTLTPLTPEIPLSATLKRNLLKNSKKAEQKFEEILENAESVSSFESESSKQLRTQQQQLQQQKSRQKSRQMSVSSPFRRRFGGVPSEYLQSYNRNGQPFEFVKQEMISEYRNIFELYDEKKKGYLTREEFIKSLSGLYDLENIIGRMKVYGYENERNIYIDQFIKMVIPDNYIVPETVLDNLVEIYREKFNNGPAIKGGKETQKQFQSFGTMIASTFER